MSKRILHVIDSLQRGGAESLLISIIHELRDYEHLVVTLNGIDDYNVQNLSKINLAHKGLLFLHYSASKFKEIIHDFQPDIIHSHLFWSNCITKISTRNKSDQFEVFFTIHTILSYEAFRRIYYVKLEKIITKPHHRLVSVSNTVQEDYFRYVKVEKSEVLYNFISDIFFYKPRNFILPLQKLRCVAVGNHKFAKNYSFLVSNFPKNSSITLDIFGRDDDQFSLAKLIESQQIKNVNHRGLSNTISSELLNYDLFIMSSIYEGQPISALEAMASGLPVLLSDIPVLREVGGDAAVYFDLVNRDSLSEILDKILMGAINLNDKSKLCFKRANEIARKDIYVLKLKRLYED